MTQASPAARPPAVRLHGIVKRFPGVVANDGVDFAAAEGEVHALLGENGAGKSTLSNILTGLYRPDEGEIELYGRHVSFSSPRDALGEGLFMVHQHFRLVEPFSVAENVILGDHRGEGKRFLVNARRHERRVAELGERYRIAVDPRARVWQLSLGEQQRVEILKALYREARILILDEPTAVLTPQEAEALFETLRVMAAEGRTIIFISHKLHEVKAVSDRVTVLRAGKTVATVDTADATPRSLASLMVGRDVAPVQRIDRFAELGGEGIGGPVLEVRDLWAAGDRGGDALRGVDLTVRAGEILAIAGVAGNGQTELTQTLVGLERPVTGSIEIDGTQVTSLSTDKILDLGVGYVPEDRLHDGLVGGFSVAENLVLDIYDDEPFAKRGVLDLRAIRDNAEHRVGEFDIRPTDPDAGAGTLSGGNQQKVVLARELSRPLRLLIVAQPTRGLDVGSMEFVHRRIVAERDLGGAVVLVSSELDEVLGLADRIAVMFHGRIVGEVPPGTPAEEIGLLMAGHTGDEPAGAGVGGAR